MIEIHRNLPVEKQEAIFDLANVFSDTPILKKPERLEDALFILRAQHRNVMPREPESELIVIAFSPEPIEGLYGNAYSALQREHFGAALKHANSLYKLGILDWHYHLGSYAIAAAVRFHREFAQKILEKFKGTDVKFSLFGKECIEDVEDIEETGIHNSALIIVREFIHIVALNRFLGDDAFEMVDPMAIVDVP